MENFQEFFNIGDIDHLKAWNEFNETGMFPVQFYKKMPIDFNVTDDIKQEVEHKMAKEYIKMKIILGICDDVKQN
jgi:hypothetical protein